MLGYPCVFPPFGKLKASKDRIYAAFAVEWGERNPQQIADAPKFIFVAQGETCSSYTETYTCKKPPRLPVVTEIGRCFQIKRRNMIRCAWIGQRCYLKVTP